MVQAQAAASPFIPLSRLGRDAEGIMGEVRRDGFKIITRNDAPDGVLFSMDRYRQLLEELEDMELAAAALERETQNADKKYVPMEQVLREAGITQADLDAVDDSEIEFE